jgi:hypothetical protein
MKYNNVNIYSIFGVEMIQVDFIMAKEAIDRH